MTCDQITPYLPGYAGGDLRLETQRLVEAHVASCSTCAAEALRLEHVTGTLAALRTREIEPPPMMLGSILESIPDHRARRLFPPIVPPQVAPDLIRVVQDNREAIASVGATAVVAAGAAYALWRAIQRRPAGRTATS